MYQDCYQTVYRYFTKSSPLPTYFTQRGDNVKVSLLVWRTRYTDTFCNAVDRRFELALQVQRWTRDRIANLAGGGGEL